MALSYTNIPDHVSWDDLASLRDEGRLFALVDACGNKDVPGHAADLKEDGFCLYEELAEDYYNTEAPHLVRPKDEMWEHIVGLTRSDDAWGFFLETSDRVATSHLVQHWRNWVNVYPPKGNRTVLFRFYDPRLLETFLSTMTPEMAQAFCGDLGAFHIAPNSKDKRFYTYRINHTEEAGIASLPPYRVGARQFEALRGKQTELRHERILDFLRKGFGEKLTDRGDKDLLALVARSEKTAKKLGFEMERDKVKFIVLTTAFGEGFHENGVLPEAKSILSGPDFMSGQSKIERLTQVARRKDASRLGAA